MEKLFLNTILFTIFTLGAIAQNSGHSIGIQVSRYYSDTGDPGQQTVDVLELERGFARGHFTSGEPDLAYSVGFTHGYRLKNWLKLESSLSLSTINYKFDGGVTLRNEFLLEQSDIELWQLVRSVEGNNNIYFMELQFGPQFSIGWERIRAFIKPYMEANYYLSNRRTEKLTYEDDIVIEKPTGRDTTTNFNSIYFAPGLSLGVEARVTKRIELALILFGEVFLQSIDTLDTSNDLPYSGGASFRINYRL